jgi:hypothetical protein
LRRLALTLLLLCLAAPAGAHPVALSAGVSPGAVEMAGHVSYTVFAEWPEGWNVASPRPRGPLENFELVGCAKPEITEPAEGRFALALTCDLVVFGSGRLDLPTWEMRLTDADGNSETATTPPLTVDVIAPLIDESARPPKAQELVRRDWLKIGLYVLAGLLAGALLVTLIVLLVRWIIRRITGRGKEKHVLPPEPADRRALRRLSGDELRELLAGHESKPYYSELTDIVREYIEGRYGVPALEQTTTETLRALAAIDLEGHDSFLRELLTVADLAKFAGQAVTDQRWAADRDRARRLVEETKPRPEPDPEKGDAA